MLSNGNTLQPSEQLQKLKEDPSYSDLDYLIDGLIQLSDASRLSPTQVEALVNLLPQMKMDLQEGVEMQEIRNKIETGSDQYHNQNWDVKNVFQGDNKQIIFNYLADYQEKTSTNLDVDFVLFVMNDQEAKQLVSEDIFQDYPDELSEDYHDLQDELADKNITDWEKNYRKSRQEWRPFVESEQSIDQLISQVFGDIPGLKKNLVPAYIDPLIFIQDERTSDWDRLARLRKDGCFVILDVISMRHPDIMHAFHLSALEFFPDVIIIKIAHHDSIFNIIQKLILKINQRLDLEFHRRRNFIEDTYVVEVSKLDKFSIWFRDRVERKLPDEIRKEQQASRFFRSR